jgi:hypothetical protein
MSTTVVVAMSIEIAFLNLAHKLGNLVAGFH